MNSKIDTRNNMIGVLLLTHGRLGEELIGAAAHTLGGRPPRLATLPVEPGLAPERLAERLRTEIAALDAGRGVLILADVYGATHTNVACALLERNRIELIAGVNLPMLLRVLNYRELPMEDLINKGLSGGFGGIVCASHAPALKEAGG
jgi:PTS system ascorbate-specific IIA component